MKTVVLTTTYPAVSIYLADFVDSLNSQDDMDYDLLVINDGLENIDDYFQEFLSPFIYYNLEGAPSRLRKEGILRSINMGYDCIIFADADDFFELNRIRVSKDLLQQHFIVFNELVLFNYKELFKEPFLSKRFKQGQLITISDIKKLNCLGLSNTAINSKIIGYDYLDIPDSIMAFDWLFYSSILAGGYKAFFTNETITCYRQHENNIASIRELSDEQILKGVEVKYSHYLFMSKYCKWYKEQASSFKFLLDRITHDKNFCQNYCQAIRKNKPKQSLWWEAIKTLGELGL